MHEELDQLMDRIEAKMAKMEANLERIEKSIAGKATKRDLADCTLRALGFGLVLMGLVIGLVLGVGSLLRHSGQIGGGMP